MAIISKKIGIKIAISCDCQINFFCELLPIFWLCYVAQVTHNGSWFTTEFLIFSVFTVLILFHLLIYEILWLFSREPVKIQSITDRPLVWRIMLQQLTSVLWSFLNITKLERKKERKESPKWPNIDVTIQLTLYSENAIWSYIPGISTVPVGSPPSSSNLSRAANIQSLACFQFFSLYAALPTV